MTNTSPITTSNFIAGTIGVGIALIIMPQIIIGTVGAQQQGVARSAANDLVEDINSICGGSDSESGSIDLESGYVIELDYDDYRLKNPQGDVIERQQMACDTLQYEEIDSTWEDYDLDKAQADCDNNGNNCETHYDLSEG